MYLVFFNAVPDVNMLLQVCSSYEQARQLVHDLHQWDEDHSECDDDYVHPGSSSSESVPTSSDEASSSQSAGDDTTTSGECSEQGYFNPEYELLEQHDCYTIVGTQIGKYYGWHFSIEE